MEEKKLEEALNYAKISNKIESLHPTKEELKIIKDALSDSKVKKEMLSDYVRKGQEKKICHPTKK